MWINSHMEVEGGKIAFLVESPEQLLEEEEGGAILTVPQYSPLTCMGGYSCSAHTRRKWYKVWEFESTMSLH